MLNSFPYCNNSVLLMKIFPYHFNYCVWLCLSLTEEHHKGRDIWQEENQAEPRGTSRCGGQASSSVF